MKVWTFRETLVLAMLRDQGHAPIPDQQEGWATCPTCHVSWFIRRRVQLADLPPTERGKDEGIQWADPLAFSTCRP
jgi:hypothetical protein